MPLATATPANTAQMRSERRRRLGKIAILAVIVAVAALCAFALLLSREWPFAQAPVLQNLQEASDSQVQFRTFRETFFPSPGCILEGLVFHHEPGEAKPLITIRKLTIQGSYVGLLSRRVSRIIAEGMLVSIPPFDIHSKFHTTPSKITIAEIVANGSAVEFGSSDPGNKPLRFDIHEASLRNVGWKGPLTYHVDVHNPKPPGDVTAQGEFGLWNRTAAGETPISGDYKLEQADLSVYGGIAGKLSSTGKFGGKLAHIDISGTTDTPDFEVESSGHAVRMTTRFSAYVDATRGDTFLKQVDVNFRKTHVVAQGSIASSPGGKGKTALIDLRARNARIQDVLLLFVEATRAPMSGSVTLQARAEIPPGPEGFLKKVKLHGSFGITGGMFSKPSTQEDVDKLSAGARGEKEKDKEKDKNAKDDAKDKDKDDKDDKDRSDPETVLTDLNGQVNLLGGMARFSDLSFGVPGATSRLHGTYDLIDHKIDLRGQMQVDTQISNTSSGTKAFLLKVMEPFFKKKRKGEIVPIRIAGTYEHPTFGLDLDDKNAQKVPPPAIPPSKANLPSPKPK
jgi:AsmA-like protein